MYNKKEKKIHQLQKDSKKSNLTFRTYEKPRDQIIVK
jgi:hypothetical protein